MKLTICLSLYLVADERWIYRLHDDKNLAKQASSLSRMINVIIVVRVLMRVAITVHFFQHFFVACK